MKFSLKISICFILVLIAQLGLGQRSFTNESRAEYILDIAKYVNWGNEESFSTFNVGVISPDTLLFHELKKLAEQRKKRRGKPIKIHYFKDIPSVDTLQLLFVNKKHGYDISKILSFVSGKNILLISENYPFQKTMINFIVINGTKRFEVNRSKLEKEGFSVSRLFLASAVKTEADWEELYEKTEFLLEKEKEVVRSQQEVINKQKKEIHKQEEAIQKQIERIKHQQEKIEEQKKQLGELSFQIKEKQEVLSQKLIQLEKQQLAIDKKELELAKKQEEINQSNKILEQQEKAISGQKEMINEQKSVLNEQLKEIHKQRLILYLFLALIILISILGYFMYRAYKIKKEANIQLREKNEEISQQKEEILTQRDEIENQRDNLIIKNREIEQQKEEILTQRDEIESQVELVTKQRDQIRRQNREITGSIVYAERIQSAILTLPEYFNKIIDQYFIFFKPKDIVSGDFYWASKRGKKIVIAAVDCTGHGVPGAFMSMLGATFLTEIVDKNGITKPSEILNQLRIYIIEALKQKGTEGEVKEGMDMALCTIDRETDTLEYAGALNPLYYFQDNELLEIKADRQPVSITMYMKEFTNHKVKIQRGDVFYLFSDGFPDQFGGPYGRKFMKKRFRDLLRKIHKLPMSKQRKELEKNFNAWKNEGKKEQVDDVLVIGMKY